METGKEKFQISSLTFQLAFPTKQIFHNFYDMIERVGVKILTSKFYGFSEHKNSLKIVISFSDITVKATLTAHITDVKYFLDFITM